MSDLIKYSIELPINSSVNVLYKRLSTPSGLAEWFADNVNLKNNIYTFFWDDGEQSAKILKKKTHYMAACKEVPGQSVTAKSSRDAISLRVATLGRLQ